MHVLWAQAYGSPVLPSAESLTVGGVCGAHANGLCAGSCQAH